MVIIFMYVKCNKQQQQQQERNKQVLVTFLDVVPTQF